MTFSCTYCDYVGNTSRQLRNHVIKHHSKIFKVTCELCGEGFAENSFLKKHFFKEHEKVKHICFICNRTCNDAYNLKLHLQIHEGIRTKIKCDHCARLFLSKSALKRHEVIHTGNTSMCHICGKCYVQKDLLKIHMRAHAGDKRYECEFCGKKFLTSQLRKVHYVKHTKEKKFECDICKKRYSQRGTLTQHLKLHSGIRPYECIVCLKTFVTRAAMKGHKCHEISYMTKINIE